MQVFFYGLFMDASFLRKNGLSPTMVRKGHVEDYALKIGARASLIPQSGAVAYGLLMEADANALEQLYAEPSVADYISEQVEVITDDNERVLASCYNLPEERLSGTNSSYASELLKLAQKLEFPDAYQAHIREMIKS